MSDESTFWRMEAEQQKQHRCTDYELCPLCNQCIYCCEQDQREGDLL